MSFLSFSNESSSKLNRSQSESLTLSGTEGVAVRRYVRDLTSKGVKVTVDYKSFKPPPIPAALIKKSNPSPYSFEGILKSVNIGNVVPVDLLCSYTDTITSNTLGAITDISENIFDILPQNLYEENTIAYNLGICFNNLSSNPFFHTLRYLFQEILMTLHNFKCHFGAAKAFYRKIYEIVLAFGRTRRGVYYKCQTKMTQNIIRLVQELEELIDSTCKQLKVYTYPDEYIQYILIGNRAKKTFSSFESSLSSVMTGIYSEINQEIPNVEVVDEFIGLQKVESYDTVGDLKALLDKTSRFPKLSNPTASASTGTIPDSNLSFALPSPMISSFKTYSPNADDADAPSSKIIPADAHVIPSTVSQNHFIKTTEFKKESARETSAKKSFDIWKSFIIRHYKVLFELLDPSQYPKEQFYNTATGAVITANDSPEGEEDSDLTKEFVYHLAGEFQKLTSKYNRMLTLVEISGQPIYANLIPNIPLRLFWAKYLGDVYEVNLSVFSRALVEYLTNEAGYNANKAKTFAYPVVKALQHYSSLTTISLAPGGALNSSKASNASNPKGSSGIPSVPPLSKSPSQISDKSTMSDSLPMNAFTTTVFDLVAFTESIPPSESDTTIKLFKAFVKLHLSSSLALYPNQDHVGVFDPYSCLPEKELKKALYILKTKRGFLYVPDTVSRRSGRSTTILHVLSKVKKDIQVLYLDFNHVSSEAALIAALLSQLHLKYTAGDGKTGSPPVASVATSHAATRTVTKPLFFEFFALFLEKLSKDAVIVFDNIEAQSSSTLSSLAKGSASTGAKITRMTSRNALEPSSNGLVSKAIDSFMTDLISFCAGKGKYSYVTRFSFLFVGLASEKLTAYDNEGLVKAFNLPVYSETNLTKMAFDIYPTDFRALFDASIGSLGHMVTLGDVCPLYVIRDISQQIEKKKAALAKVHGQMQLTSDQNEELLKTIVFPSIRSQLIEGDEILCASCILPNIGSFPYPLAWKLCSQQFHGDILRFHAAFMSLTRIGYLDYLGNNTYVISKYYDSESTFTYRNFFEPSPDSAPVTSCFPMLSNIVLQELWDLYYEYWSKEMYRMNYVAFTSPQVLDYFNTIYPHFRQVFSNFGLSPRLVLAHPRRPWKRLIVHIDAYDRIRAKAQSVPKAALLNNIEANSRLSTKSNGTTTDEEADSAPSPAASANSPAVVDQSKMRTSKLNELAFTIGGGVSKVLTRYYPTASSQIISASIVDALDVNGIAKAITSIDGKTGPINSIYPNKPSLSAKMDYNKRTVTEEKVWVAGETNEDADEDDEQIIPGDGSIHPLEEKYYGAVCDFVEQLLRDDDEQAPSMFNSRDRAVKQCNSILSMFFPLQQLARGKVQPALIWVRGLTLAGVVRQELRQAKLATACFSRAFEMVLEIEALPNRSLITADPFEPIGKFKADLQALLTAGKGDGLEFKRQNSLPLSSSFNANDNQGPKSKNMTKDDNCSIM